MNILSKFHEFLTVGTCLKMALYQNHAILVQWYNWYKKVQLRQKSSHQTFWQRVAGGKLHKMKPGKSTILEHFMECFIEGLNDHMVSCQVATYEN